MPQIFRIGSYTVYFWSNEGEPLEPIHVHIAEGRASSAGTKIWITSSGKTVLANNNANIPAKVLRGIHYENNRSKQHRHHAKMDRIFW